MPEYYEYDIYAFNRIAEEKRAELMENVRKAKASDPEAIEAVLFYLNSRIIDYSELVYTGTRNFNYCKSTHRYFIAEFEKNTSLYQSICKKSLSAKCIADSRFKYVQAICKQSMTKEDFESECKSVILQLLKECRDYKKFFIYFGKSFHKRLAQHIKHFVANDVLSHQELIEFDLDINEVEYELDDYKSLSFGVEPYDYQKEELDSNWLSGFTCNELFRCLTAHERLALKLIYIDQIDHTKASKILGVNETQIRRHINNIIDKVRNQSYHLCHCGKRVMASAKVDYIYCEECIEKIKEYNLAVDKYYNVHIKYCNRKTMNNFYIPDNLFHVITTNILRKIVVNSLYNERKCAKINCYNNKKGG